MKIMKKIFSSAKWVLLVSAFTFIAVSSVSAFHAGGEDPCPSPKDTICKTSANGTVLYGAYIPSAE